MNDQQEARLLHLAERVTVAIEQGAGARAELEQELKRYKRWYEEARDRSSNNWERVEAYFRSNAALRGVITKLQRRLKGSKA